MKYEDFLNAVSSIKHKNQKLSKMINIMYIPIMNIDFKKYEFGKEYLCKYDLSNIWSTYSYKLRKSIFYINEYYKYMLLELKLQSKAIKFDSNISIPCSFNSEIATYNFDSMILSFATIIEGDEKNNIGSYLSKITRYRLNTIFPSKFKMLYWEINILRNRIIHTTCGRYSEKNDECRRFYDFSTKPSIINIDKDKNINIKCNIPDVYSNKLIQTIIKKEILKKNSHDNIFDIIFPNKSSKRKNKKNPTVIIHDSNLNFDHICTSIKLVMEIQTFIENIVTLFMKEFLQKIPNKEEILKSKTIFKDKDGNEVEYNIKDIYQLGN